MINNTKADLAQYPKTRRYLGTAKMSTAAEIPVAVMTPTPAMNKQTMIAVEYHGDGNLRVNPNRSKPQILVFLESLFPLVPWALLMRSL